MSPSVSSKASQKLATIGYEGHTLQSFIRELESRKIRNLVDVRELPLSRKKGFSKSSLSSALAEHGIAYHHVRGLGAPREARHALKGGGDFERFSEIYLEHLAGETQSLKELKRIAREGSTAIMCVEKKAAQCHRGLIGQRLVRSGFTVTHLCQ